ncbi:ISAs1 family transposase, partial [Psychromonas hadalis]|uniref:ISAs1 family transposase n=1 Tax=Psychromonas hadalis TaxID=211669 RepID=UPI0012EC3C4A
DSKTNEIPVMQSILDHLEINGSVITADAMHCQKKTAEIICEKKGDYVLQVKKNQATLLEEIKAYFHKIRRDDPFLLDSYDDVDGEHGRINEYQTSITSHLLKLTSKTIVALRIKCSKSPHYYKVATELPFLFLFIQKSSGCKAL